MSDQVEHYIALAALSALEWSDGAVDDPFSERVPKSGFNRAFGGRESFSGDDAEFRAFLEKKCGFEVPEYVAANVLRVLAECLAVRVSENEFAGTFIKLSEGAFENFRRVAREEYSEAEQEGLSDEDILASQIDFPAAAAFLKYPIFKDFDEHEEKWLERALSGLREKVIASGGVENLSDDVGSDSNSAPASDRIVKLNDNQIAETNEKTEKLLEKLEAGNGVPDEPGARERIIGQIKAGRELIRSGEVRAYLLYEVFVKALNEILQKYGDETIRALANALLGAIVSNILE